MIRRRSVPIVVPFILLASVIAPSAAQAETEGHRREAKWRQNAERVERELGTRDLTDLHRRAAQIRATEIARERVQRQNGQKFKSVNADGDINWTSLGPTSSPTYTDPINKATADQNDTGLITAIATHPSDPKIIVVGTAGGGLWRTEDTGSTWTAVGNELPAGSLQIGAVAIAPSDANRLYAGTGCGDSSTTKLGQPSFAVRASIGALRSNDGGKTWAATKTSPPSEFYWAISVSPTNADELLVGTNRGIYRSTDGGDTWAGVLNQVIGVNNPYVTSIARTGTDGNTIYAGFYRPAEIPGLVARSTDGGVTWEFKSTGWPGNIETRGRAQVAASATNPGRVYVLISGLDDKQVDMARSDDGGDTWQALGLAGKNADILSTQGNFANVLAVHPTNPDVVYAGGLDLWRTTDGGGSWTQISDWSAPGTPTLPYLHSDQHAVVFGSDGTVYIGNDGGIYRMEQTPVKFVGLNRGILSWLVDDICASPDGSVMLNGAQDNGTSQRVGTTGEWRQVGPADGYACAVNRADPSIFLVSWQNERMTRLTNGGETVQMSTGLNESDKNRLFRTIIRQHPTEAGRLFTATKRKIWQSNDTGLTWFEATKEMPLIDSVSDFSISSADGNRMVLVDTKCQVLESTDGGANWTRLGECPVGRLSSAVRGEKEDANILYIASKSPLASRERVWRSSDKGATWQPISRTGQENGLPDLPIFSFEIDPKSKNVLWAGTFIGLYRSADGGATWSRHGAGLPNVPVTDMVFMNDENNILIGTAGRGVWQAGAGTRPAAVPTVPSSTGPSVNALTANFSFTPANPRPGRSIEFIDESTGGAVSWNWDFAGQKTSAQVYPSHIFANPGTYAVKLTVSDGTNSASFTRNITVAYPDTGTGSVLTYLVPVIVRGAGRGGEQFDTELTMTNRSGNTVELTFTFKGGGSKMTATYSMAAGQEIVPAFDFLTSKGMTFPDAVAGTLRIAVSGASSIAEFSAQSRVLTPPTPKMAALNVIGKFGLAYPATPLQGAATREAVLYGLQETTGARSNVACVNAGGTASPKEIILEVRYRNGETGILSDKVVKTLQPFEFFQWNAPLAGLGIQQGWAQVKKTEGEDQFLCYATIVDNTNGDGAYVPMTVVDSKLETTEAMLPVVLDAGGYKSELTIANRTPRTLSGEFAIVLSSGEEEWGEIDVPPLSQFVMDDIIGQLREAGFNTPAGNTIASMYFNFAVEEYEGGKGADMEEIPVSASDVYVGVRTYEEPTGGEKGRFGLAYGSLPLGQAADSAAYVYGLQQTGTRGVAGGTRSNIAFIHALGGDVADLTLDVTYFDNKGVQVGTATVELKPGQFKQIGTPLANLAEQGYARVVRTSGNDQFITYGVLNDQGNNDGSFITMIVP